MIKAKTSEFYQATEALPEIIKKTLLESLKGRSVWLEDDGTRELEEVCKKPHTVKEIVGLINNIENVPKLNSSLSYANYDEVKVYDLPQQVGLDVCSFDITIKNCNGKVFEECIKKYMYSKAYPMIHTTTVSENNKDAYIPIQGWDQKKYQRTPY